MDPKGPMPAACRPLPYLRLSHCGDFSQQWCVPQKRSQATTLHRNECWGPHWASSALRSQYAFPRLPATVLGRPLVVEAGGISLFRSPPQEKLPRSMLHIPMKIAIDGCQMVSRGYNNTQGGISKLYNNQIGKGGVIIWYQKMGCINVIVGGGGVWHWKWIRLTQFFTTHHTINYFGRTFIKDVDRYKCNNTDKIRAVQYLFLLEVECTNLTSLFLVDVPFA